MVRTVLPSSTEADDVDSTGITRRRHDVPAKRLKACSRRPSTERGGVPDDPCCGSFIMLSRQPRGDAHAAPLRSASGTASPRQPDHPRDRQHLRPRVSGLTPSTARSADPGFRHQRCPPLSPEVKPVTTDRPYEMAHELFPFPSRFIVPDRSSPAESGDSLRRFARGWTACGARPSETRALLTRVRGAFCEPLARSCDGAIAGPDGSKTFATSAARPHG